MATSYNGWYAAPGWSVGGGQIAVLSVAGETFAPGVLAGDVHTVFQYLVNNLHARVEPVYAPGWHEQDDWGYSYRQNRNANNLSCHSSGTAIDYNATRHPNGTRGTFNAAQIATIRQLINVELEGVVDWGGDWGPGSTPDWMHFEISKGKADVARVAAKIRGGVSPTSPPVSGVQYEEYKAGVAPGSRVLELGSAGDDVKFVQRWHGLEQDGYFGPQTEAKVKATQERNGLAVDGVVGPATFAVMGIGTAPAKPKMPAPPAWDIPAGHYLGHIAGPNESHGGAVALDRDNVLWWQRGLIALGCVAGQSDFNSGWADAKWEDATTVATRTWFARFYPGQQFTDRAYRDDWNRMIDILRSKGLL